MNISNQLLLLQDIIDRKIGKNRKRVSIRVLVEENSILKSFYFAKTASVKLSGQHNKKDVATSSPSSVLFICQRRKHNSLLR